MMICLELTKYFIQILSFSMSNTKQSLVWHVKEKSIESGIWISNVRGGYSFRHDKPSRAHNINGCRQRENHVL